MAEVFPKGGSTMRLITRTFAVMAALVEEPTGLSLQQLAERTSVPVGSMHRLLSALSDEHFVVRSPASRRYFFGPTALAVVEAATQSRRLHQAPPPLLERAALETAATLFITETAAWGYAVCVAVAPGRRAPSVQLGEEFPLGTTSATRVLLMDMRDEEVAEILSRSLYPFPEVDLQRDQDWVMSRVRRTRRAGFDVGDGELGPGIWTLSVPLRESSDAPRQSLSIVTTSARAARSQTRTALMTMVLEVVRELSHSKSVGASQPDPSDLNQRASPGIMCGEMIED